MQNETRQWTPEEDLRIEKLRAEGRSAREIATALNRPYSSLRSRVDQLIKLGRFRLLTAAESEARVVKSRERRSTKLKTRASSYIASMPNTKDVGYAIGVLYGDGFVNFKNIKLVRRT